ncbi:FAD/FMN-containing dehydrogenase [Luteibacter sp. UNCMF331Sha3.1]|uniref:FAD-binding oxidoreductase n=1 Tax=Luteibacter sp. UNCMF331Sha3.1 TaxID=1502760 RepID=UPI0008C1C8AD|nr:FAD-binding oxidoreductase [Luteibacter sp. UNCMF331Sha3.1]SEM53126.1 FAD/FMN-containing dehydrogenase [Luteibacter sp. UNCMF331Sha3.1]
MDRRTLLKNALALPLLPYALTTDAFAAVPFVRARPGMKGWPSDDDWAALGRKVGGRLSVPRSPFLGDNATRAEAIAEAGNPFYIGDQPALTQTSGWFGAWDSRPSAWALTAENAQDIAAAVEFAGRHRVRLVVKGGGHSYQGTSCGADTLLVWTRRMNGIALHDAFVPAGARPGTVPEHAVSVGAGAMWIDAYDAVTTRGGRYVQGGGCTTVGVAGLVTGGGFGSFSKAFGSAASQLLEAEVVTADGRIRVVNAFRDPDIFWALKGGGGGNVGIVTRLTLRTHDLPGRFGGVSAAIEADSDEAYRALATEALRFYRDALCNPTWGEQMRFGHDRTLTISMVFQGIDKATAERTWAPFLAWVAARPAYALRRPLRTLDVEARHFWDAAFFRKYAPQLIVQDDRAGASERHFVWKGDRDQVGWYIHAYASAWLPGRLLADATLDALARALVEAAAQSSVELHFNKGLYGAPQEALAATRDTATHPAVLDAFALAIVGHSGAPHYEGLPGATVDTAQAKRGAASVRAAYQRLRRVAPGAGSYVSESDYFQADWQDAFWGDNYRRLLATKRRHDPERVFVVHHGVGSEDTNT